MPRHNASGVAVLIGMFLVLTAPAPSPAQDRLSPPGVSPALPSPASSTTYLPYGALGGGFIPYTSGPGGGLGVMTRPRLAATGTGSAAGMSSMGAGTTTTLAPRGRAALTTLAPLGRIRLGAGGSMPGRAMSRPRALRPPVGSYPFRPPTTPGGGDSAPAPAMSM